MKLYLVKCSVQKSYYMDETKTEEAMHIVEADSEAEVWEKVQKHYEAKDSEYHVSHWVNVIYCNEVIR